VKDQPPPLTPTEKFEVRQLQAVMASMVYADNTWANMQQWARARKRAADIITTAERRAHRAQGR